MEKSEYFHLGKITKTHALRGEVTLFLDVDIPENYKKLKRLFLDINGKLVPHNVDRILIRGKKSILKLEGVDHIDDAQDFINLEVYLPLSDLPKLKGNRFYYHEVIGYEISEEDKEEPLGKLKFIYESTGQDLFAVNHNDKEVLIPIVDEFIVKIDHENKQIILHLPEGLLDVYLS